METQPAPDVNEVVLTGRVSAAPESRELPSGAELVTFRVVVRRPPSKVSTVTVDTVDVACWSGRSRRTAARLEIDDRVEVGGALRRRFFRAGGGAQSRYEVEASTLRRVRTSA